MKDAAVRAALWLLGLTALGLLLAVVVIELKFGGEELTTSRTLAFLGKILAGGIIASAIGAIGGAVEHWIDNRSR